VLVSLLVCAGLANAAAGVKRWDGLAPASPKGWVGIQTQIDPDDGNVLAGIANNQAVIAAGLDQGAGARVLVFPEAILPNWYSGTQAQFAAAVPAGQVWLLGVQMGARDAVVRVQHGYADPVPVAQAAGLLLGGDWQPWNPRTWRPAWWQRVFALDGQRVWAAICVEQVQPWTWLEALWQRPTVILAQSNAWWAAPGSAAPWIQDASTRAWARLMGVAVVGAVNL
jgi:predicted amidohydrolase